MKEFKPEDKITVISTVRGGVGVNLPELNYKRKWERKGAKIEMPFEVIEKGLYNRGFEQLIKEGSLYIEDLDAKIALGLEAEGAEKSENIIVLNDVQKKRLLTTAPIGELKEMVGKLSYDQLVELADFAIFNKLIDFERNDIIKKACNISIIDSVMADKPKG